MLDPTSSVGVNTAFPSLDGGDVAKTEGLIKNTFEAGCLDRLVLDVRRYGGVDDDDRLFAIRYVFINSYAPLAVNELAIADTFMEELQPARATVCQVAT